MRVCNLAMLLTLVLNGDSGGQMSMTVLMGHASSNPRREQARPSRTDGSIEVSAPGPSHQRQNSVRGGRTFASPRHSGPRWTDDCAMGEMFQTADRVRLIARTSE